MIEEIKEIKNKMIKTSQPNGVFLTAETRDKIIYYINNSLEEIERLNNIINEIESYLEKTIIDGGTRGSMTFWYKQIYDYLQELKGSEKE